MHLFQTRREFLLTSALAGAAFAASPQALGADARPWHQKTLRWGQTNLTEQDPARIDIDFWRAHWKRTAL